MNKQTYDNKAGHNIDHILDKNLINNNKIKKINDEKYMISLYDNFPKDKYYSSIKYLYQHLMIDVDKNSLNNDVETIKLYTSLFNKITSNLNHDIIINGGNINNRHKKMNNYYNKKHY